MLYQNLSKEELTAQYELGNVELKRFQKENFSIDISRGKPSKEQLDLSNGLFGAITTIPQGMDVRNYGEVEGIPEMRDIFAEILGVKRANVILGNNSSLNIMYDTIQRALQFGIMGSTPWNKLEKVKFLCPVPGYDRHFSICETFGIEMIAVPMDENGPVMGIVEDYVANDPCVKGIWCVPKYSNPTGITYSDEVVTRLARMKCISEDFRIFWDNAYAIHDLNEESDELKNLYATAVDAGTQDRVYMFASFSKVTFAGASVAAFAASEANVKDALRCIKMQTICPDKVNEYAHLLFLRNFDNIKAHMRKHAEIVRPKFDAVVNALNSELGNSDIANWSNPKGGYFINLNVLNGCAARVGRICKSAGLTITAVGATYPLGIDDADSNIRIAPTFASTEELDIAMRILITATKLACCEKLLNNL